MISRSIILVVVDVTKVDDLEVGIGTVNILSILVNRRALSRLSKDLVIVRSIIDYFSSV